MPLRVRFDPAKWANRASQAAAAYQAGITNPSRDWATATAAAFQTWADAVVRAAQRGAFRAGVNRAGTSKWQDRALAVGVDRYVTGVGAAQQAYAEGFEPYAQMLTNLNLPARRPKGDPANLERVRIVAEALHNLAVRRQTEAATGTPAPSGLTTTSTRPPLQ